MSCILLGTASSTPLGRFSCAFLGTYKASVLVLIGLAMDLPYDALSASFACDLSVPPIGSSALAANEVLKGRMLARRRAVLKAEDRTIRTGNMFMVLFDAALSNNLG